GTLQRRPDLGLVTIHRRRIDMPIAGFQGPGHSIFSGAAATRLIDAEPEAWDRDAVVEGDLVSDAHAEALSKGSVSPLLQWRCHGEWGLRPCLRFGSQGNKEN